MKSVLYCPAARADTDPKEPNMPRTPDLRLRLLFLAALVAAAVPAAASTWLLPAGGETWTAGTSHTVAWTGTGTSAIVTYHPLPLSMAGYTVAAFFPNTGYLTFAIPPGTPPGQYVMQVAYQAGDPAVYSQPFTIVAPPECLNGCNLVSASMPASSPWTGLQPSNACGFTAISATSQAEAYIMSALSAQCSPGYSIDPGSVHIDVTLLPPGVGTCMVGYFGNFMAEASGHGCCCQDAVPSEAHAWGDVKARYR